MILRNGKKEGNKEYYCTKCDKTFISEENIYSNYRTCPHCKERQPWKYMGRTVSEVIFGDFISKEEDGSHFIITKVKKVQSYKMDKNDDIVKSRVKEAKSDLVMDFKNKEFYIQNEKERKEVNRNTMKSWLEHNDNMSKVMDCIKLKSNKEILYFITDILRPNFTDTFRRRYSRYTGITTAFERFCKHYNDYEYIQILANGGIEFYNESYWKFNHLNEKGRTINEIIGISKLDFKIAKLLKIQKLSSFCNCKGIGEVIPFDKLKKYIELGYITNANSPQRVVCNLKDIKEICDNYNYDMDTLMNYLNVDIYRNQGIRFFYEGLTLLMDSLRMAKRMGINLKEKYPKSLKMQHDLLAMNYECYRDEFQRRGFKQVVEDKKYMKLNRNKKEESFYIRSPRDLDDLYNYAESLGNCLKSYVDGIIESKTKIYFMETEVNNKKPYIAIEVRNNIITQAYRKSNRRISKKEYNFLNEWAKDNELECSISYDNYAEEIV